MKKLRVVGNRGKLVLKGNKLTKSTYPSAVDRVDERRAVQIIKAKDPDKERGGEFRKRDGETNMVDSNKGKVTNMKGGVLVQYIFVQYRGDAIHGTLLWLLLLSGCRRRSA